MIVAAVYDTEGWCWNYQARDLREFSGLDDLVIPISGGDFDKLGSRRKFFDAALIFSWPEFPCKLVTDLPVFTVLAHHGCQWFGMDESYCAVRHATGIRNRERAEFVLPKARGVICVNEMLCDFAKSVGANAEYIPAGVNRNFFRKKKDDKTNTSDRLAIGWCGQYHGKPNTKGYEEVFLPVRDALKDRCTFPTLTNSAADPLTREQMREWYCQNDIFLCTSISEGTPMPPLESLACGVPVIATPVGDLPNVIKHGENGLLVSEWRDEDSARETANDIISSIRLVLNDNWLDGAKGYARHSTRRISWKMQAPKWLDFIRERI